jgi:hypothetical protein
MSTSQASALAEISSHTGTVAKALTSSSAVAPASAASPASTATAASASAASPALNMLDILDTKSNKEGQEITIILMGGAHTDPTPCFLLSLYLEQNAKKIQDAGLRIEMGFETDDVDPEAYEVTLKINAYVLKIVEWLRRTRLKTVASPTSTEYTYSYTKDEVADFIISHTEMDNNYKRYFLKKIYEDFAKFSGYINFWNSRNQVLARKAHVNLFQQLLKYGILSFPLEPVSANETDYASEIFERLYSGQDIGIAKVEKERIERMGTSIGKSIKKLATTGGLILVPSLGLSHMHRLEAYISDTFKQYSIRIKSFAVTPPNYGVLIRHKNNIGNEKHWIPAISEESFSDIKKRIEEVDSTVTKNYYNANPYSEIMIKQNEQGEFFCPTISDYIDSVILGYSRLPLIKEILAAEEVKSQKEFQLLKGLITQESLVEDNATVLNGAILARRYHYSFKLNFKEGVNIFWQVTQIGYAEPGVFTLGVGFVNSHKVMTLFRIQKGEGYDFDIESLNMAKEKETFQLKLLVFPVPVKNYHGIGMPPVTIEGVAQPLSGPKTSFRCNCNNENLWLDHLLSPVKEFFHLKEKDQALRISSRKLELSQGSQTNLKTYQARYETLPLETNSLIKWRNPSIQEFITASKVLGGMSYRIQAGVDKNSEIALKVTQFGLAKPGELWLGVSSGVGKPIITLLKLYKQEGQDFYIDFPSLLYSKEKDSDHYKMEARVGVYNRPHENYLLTAYDGQRYETFTVNKSLGDNWQEDPLYPPEVFGDKLEACVASSNPSIAATASTKTATAASDSASMAEQKTNSDQKAVKETRNVEDLPKENAKENPIAGPMAMSSSASATMVKPVTASKAIVESRPFLKLRRPTLVQDARFSDFPAKKFTFKYYVTAGSVLKIKATNIGITEAGFFSIGLGSKTGTTIYPLATVRKGKGYDFLIYNSVLEENENLSMELVVVNLPEGYTGGPGINGNRYKEVVINCKYEDIWQEHPDYPVVEQYTMESSQSTQSKKETWLQAMEKELERTESWEETNRRGTQLIEKLMAQQNTAASAQPNKSTAVEVLNGKATVDEEMNKKSSDEKSESEILQLKQYKARCTSNRNVKTGETKYTIRLLKDEEANAAASNTAANGGSTAASAIWSHAAGNGMIKPKLALKASKVGSSKNGCLDVGIKEANAILPLFRVKKTAGHDFRVNSYSINSELTEVNFSVVRTNVKASTKGKPVHLNVDTAWKEDAPLKEKVHSP